VAAHFLCEKTLVANMGCPQKTMVVVEVKIYWIA
jgi:hypothetical protein